jgi:hypothetical protein
MIGAVVGIPDLYVIPLAICSCALRCSFFIFSASLSASSLSFSSCDLA